MYIYMYIYIYKYSSRFTLTYSMSRDRGSVDSATPRGLILKVRLNPNPERIHPCIDVSTSINTC